QTVPMACLAEPGSGKPRRPQAIQNPPAAPMVPFFLLMVWPLANPLRKSSFSGHEKGAFTGAQQAMKGKFELANDGTIFLDEISDMSPLAQVKILRVLEYGEFERLGSERMLNTNARIICATNVSLRDRVR